MATSLLQAAKPKQNAYTASFKGELRDECLSEHWLTTLGYDRGVIVAMRQDYKK
ncbi:integrase core domain-containing protein [Candidatus Burkholderia verschuerenii]|uniref:integrase core domain-containing protein n=1 Tax=Candidatus Burkholderia verschuerenii TaxID=242163 RepID=UPI00351AAB82